MKGTNVVSNPLSMYKGVASSSIYLQAAGCPFRIFISNTIITMLLTVSPPSAFLFIQSFTAYINTLVSH